MTSPGVLIVLPAAAGIAHRVGGRTTSLNGAPAVGATMLGHLVPAGEIVFQIPRKHDTGHDGHGDESEHEQGGGDVGHQERGSAEQGGPEDQSGRDEHHESEPQVHDYLSGQGYLPCPTCKATGYTTDMQLFSCSVKIEF